MPRNVRLTRIINRAGDVAYQLSNMHFSDFHPTMGWKPDINAFRYDDRFEVCVDLAGVDKDAIKVEVLPDRLRIDGNRRPPTSGSEDCRQVLALEIESGRFGREIHLNHDVDPEQVTARQENGLLWITLPFLDA